MKKTIFTICALLAAGTACIAGCSKGQTNQDTRHSEKEPTRITVEEDEKGEKNCPDGNCHEDKKHVKPNFKFEPPAEEKPAEETENGKAPEKSKDSFGKKRRFDKKFKKPAPDKNEKMPEPGVENGGTVLPEDNEKSDK